MRVCPVCHARAFDDAEVCYGCMHRFSGKEPAAALMPGGAHKGGARRAAAPGGADARSGGEFRCECGFLGRCAAGGLDEGALGGAAAAAVARRRCFRNRAVLGWGILRERSRRRQERERFRRRGGHRGAHRAGRGCGGECGCGGRCGSAGGPGHCLPAVAPR